MKRYKFTVKQRRTAVLFCLACVIAPATSFAEVPNSTNKIQIQRLIQQAETALIQNRLTTPTNKSAFSYAQQILDLAPNHPKAQKIFDQIVAHYERLGNQAVSQAESAWRQALNKAESYQARARRVAQEYPDTAVAPLNRLDVKMSQVQRTSPATIAAVSAADVHPVAVRQADPELLRELAASHRALAKAASNRGESIQAQFHIGRANNLNYQYGLKEVVTDEVGIINRNLNPQAKLRVYGTF